MMETIYSDKYDTFSSYRTYFIAAEAVKLDASGLLADSGFFFVKDPAANAQLVQANARAFLSSDSGKVKKMQSEE